MRAQLFPGLLFLLLSPTASFGGQVATQLVAIATPTGAGSTDFNPNGSQLALDSFRYDGTDIYDLTRRQIVHHLPFSGSNNDNGEFVSYSPNGKLLAICGSSKALQREFMGVYDAATWEIVHQIADERSTLGEWGCTGIAFSPDGKKLLRFAGVEPHKHGSNIIVYDATTWQVVNRVRTQAINTNPSRPSPQRLGNYAVTQTQS